MKFRSLLTFFSFVSLAFIACNKDDNLDSGPIVFHVDVGNVEAYSATATITHNGTNRDTYYGFAVEGKVDNPLEEINQMLNSSKAREVLETPLNQRKRVLKVSGLSPKRTFTYIVFGRQDGKLYGEPAVAEFTTTGSSVIATVNPNWTVKDKGHTVYSDNDYTLINVKVEGEVQERFFLAVYDATLPSTFTTIEDFIFSAIDEFSKLQNSDNDDDFWLDASKIRTESTNFYRHLSPGDYVAYAIGLNADGTPTGHYAKSEPFHVDKYPYVDTYADLLGDDWYFEDADEKMYFVTLKEKVQNRSFVMTGWGNYKQFDIVVNYNRNTGALSISYQRITDGDITLNFSSGDQTGTVYLVGAYYNAEDKLRGTSQSHTITKGTLNENGEYTFETGFSMTLDDGSKATKLGMMFVIRQNGSNKTGFARMMFPFELKKR